jgi:hypothetical protein
VGDSDLLLAGHGHAHLAVAVGDEVAGEVDGDGVERAGEPERGLVVGGDRGSWVGAAGEPAGIECDRRGDREIVLGEELAVDIAAVAFAWWLRPVMMYDRDGEHSAVVCMLVYSNPPAASASRWGVAIGLP